MAWMKFSFFGNSNNTKSLEELKRERTEIVKSPQSIRGGKSHASEDRPWGGGVSSVPFKQ
jgi:hypothetical protein